MATPDVILENRSGLFVLRPRSARGTDWLVGNVKAEALQWQSGVGLLCLESQAEALRIVFQLLQAGLTVSDVTEDSANQGSGRFSGADGIV